MSEPTTKPGADFEPRIVAFLCNWCSYAAADSAGVARFKSPSNILPVRVMCSGRVSPELILKAFMSGADGVIVLGCHIGDCHYESGNHRTAKRIPLLRKLLIYMGIEPQRLRLDWVSASESPKFARVTAEFAEEIRALGPLTAPFRVDRQVGTDSAQVAEGGAS
ncbi:MAG: hydrogenase iron-sulfur subunit [Chloroflexi bacterium]|nr:hydrogenase iron-sulfur subunit [Chloroflexota bacterium]